MSVLLERLSAADRAIAGLDSISDFVPDLDLFVTEYARKDAVLSSQIENIHTTYAEAIDYEGGLYNSRNLDDILETRNYLLAMQYGIDRTGRLPLSLRLIREMHAILLQGVRGERKTPGEFRRSQNWIGGTMPGNAVFVPPPIEEMTQSLNALEVFMHSNSGLPPLIKIGLIHAQFETIHPFLDGNGRIGRLLVTYLLVHYRVLKQPILYSSLVMKIRRNEYYERLQSVRMNGDWEGWLGFFLESVTTAALDGHVRTKQLVDYFRSAEESIRSQGGMSIGALLRIFDNLKRHPFTSASKIQNELGVTATTANKYIEILSELGIILLATKGSRNRIYRFQKYIDILGQDLLLPDAQQGLLSF